MSAFREYVYIGTYTEGCDSRGIYVCKWDEKSETLNIIGAEEQCDNPSFLAFHPSGHILYAANEMRNAARITAYKIDPSTGLLRYLNGADTDGAGMCHLSVAPNGRSVAAACYNSGHIISAAIRDDGGISEVLSSIRHEGQSVHPRQEQAHVHQAVYTADGRRLIAADLGMDKLVIYDVDDAGRLTLSGTPFVKTPDGDGPRHLLFHPNGSCIWVLTELGNHLLRYAYDRRSDVFTYRESVSALPGGFTGHAFAAELQLSVDAHFLYASIRGDYDRIVRFDAAPDGVLSNPTPFPCYGREPRMFCLDEKDRYMFIANQSGNNVAVARIDAASGAITAKCGEIEIPQACCVQYRRIGQRV